jgi:hypothetical protein
MSRGQTDFSLSFLETSKVYDPVAAYGASSHAS